MTMSSFQNRFHFLSLALGLSWLTLTAAVAAPDPARSADLFKEAMTELDMGGDLLLYVQVEDLMAKGVAALQAFAQAFPPAAESEKATAFLERLDAFLKSQGLYDGTSIGISSRPRADGLYDVKSFLARRPSEPTPPFWKMLGGTPRELPILKFIPSDAVMFDVCDVRFAELWAFLQTAIHDVGGPAIADAWASRLAAAKGFVDVEALIPTLGDELAFSIQLSRDHSCRLPLGDQPVELSNPSFLLAISVRNDAIYQMLLKQAQTAGVALEEISAGDGTLMAMPAILASPFPLRPALAQYQGYLLLCSDANTLAAALTAFRDGTGIVSVPAFRAVTKSLPREYNELSFMDPRLIQTFQTLQMAALRQSATKGDEHIAQKISDWMTRAGGSGYTAGVKIVLPNGIRSYSVTPTSGRVALLSMAIAPVGMMSAIAIPSFMRAKARARENVALNHLRIVDAAKEQWAMENNKAKGTPVEESDIAAYLHGGGLPTLLPGYHSLQINPVGVSPTVVAPDGRILELP